MEPFACWPVATPAEAFAGRGQPAPAILPHPLYFLTRVRPVFARLLSTLQQASGIKWSRLGNGLIGGWHISRYACCRGGIDY